MKIHLTEYFEETLRRVPQKTAVMDQGRSLDFQSLGKRAKILAEVLANLLGPTINRPIGVFIEKGIDSVVADMGILYSGNAYMNLDVKTPQQRIQGIIHLVRPAAIITTSKWVKSLPENTPGYCVVILDELVWDSLSFDETKITNRISRLIDTDPSCVINTSGSTGVPKGVVLNHRSFFDFTEWAIDTFDILDDEIIGSLSPSVFDIYSFELCLMMAKGSTIVIIPETLSAFPVKLLQLLKEAHVSFIFWVPTIMVNIANMGLLEKIPLEDLHMVWFAGEVFPTKQLNIWKRNLLQSHFVNLYGPIEITLDCTYFIIDRDFEDNEPIPIGKPCRNTDIILLGEDDSEVTQPFQEGELCVRGSSLAMGYYNNEAKTSTAFVQNPLNNHYQETIYRTGDIACYNEQGELLFKGRRDTLIKHSGYRIELGEIEHVIVNALKLARNGCAVYALEKKEIVFYYEADQDISVPEWRKAIGSALPKYMVPTQYVRMQVLPRNTNGKIDRLQLKERLSEIFK